MLWVFPALAAGQAAGQSQPPPQSQSQSPAQSQPPPVAHEDKSDLPEAPRATPPVAGQQSDEGLPGTISGTVMDRSGAAIAGARVTLKREDQSPAQEVFAGNEGQFSFVNVAPGSFQLTISAPGFGTQTSSAVLHPGEVNVVPPIQLEVATAVTEVHVAALTTVELAEVQIQEQEKQRVLGFIPNFYVSYVPQAAPLTPKQKFELAWKTTIDPVTFVLIGVTAGIQQSQNTFGGYGQGADGYGRRYGAALGDTITDTLIGGAILPSVFKQDPRYFYKGTGSKRSRALYAIRMSVICKGDNGHWQANYSGILGSLAAGGISNTYYPPNDRGAALTFENAAIGIGATAAANLFQEFVVKKLTPNLSKRNPPNTSMP
ncbi:MAG: carboxypeptidase-like regulatory domain-containing protein [Candidatus Acidiferrales bacterium]